MKPNETTITSVLHLHETLRKRRVEEGWVFRGQSNSEWSLVPKAGRKGFLISDDIFPDPDIQSFRAWRNDVYPFAADLPLNDYEALAYAQHHGLATRLLDWTTNPLIAAFFAAQVNNDFDGVIFCYFTDNSVSSDCKLPHPNDPRKIPDTFHGKRVKSRAMDARMLNQRGTFTFHCPPEKPISAEQHPYLSNHSTLARLIIPFRLKEELLDHLHEYGIDDSFIFPGADGVASKINWQTKKQAKKAESRDCKTVLERDLPK